MQFARSRRIDKVLGSGRLAIGYDKSDTAVADFVKIVWKVLTSMKSEKLSSFSDTTHQLLEEKISGFVVGPAASDFSRKGGLLKNIGSVGYYYKVVD